MRRHRGKGVCGYGKKTDSSRLNVLFILYVLSNYSDSDHPMSAAEIKDKVNVEFGYLSLTNAVVSQDTVKRTLEELTNKLFPSGVFNDAAGFRFGYYIYCVMEKDGEYVTYHAKDGKQPPKKYYYYENNLTTAELVTLKDAIETYSFFSEEDITQIIQKILKLRPRSFPKSKYYDVAREDREEDSLLLMNIEDLNRVIQNKNCARIIYCYYDMNKKLVPRPGYPKIIEPVHLLWSNGYYYLLAYNEKYKNIVSLRVDRITDIEEVETKNTHGVERFNPVAYRHEHPIMFGGEKEEIVLLCRDTGKNYIMNTIIDVFGKKARVSKAPDEMVERYISHDAIKNQEEGACWLKVAIETSPGGVELWATQYCNDCFIVSPEHSRERVRQRLLQGISYYQ